VGWRAGQCRVPVTYVIRWKGCESESQWLASKAPISGTFLTLTSTSISNLTTFNSVSRNSVSVSCSSLETISPNIIPLLNSQTPAIGSSYTARMDFIYQGRWYVNSPYAPFILLLTAVLAGSPVYAVRALTSFINAQALTN
jgi:hypothetical protein